MRSDDPSRDAAFPVPLTERDPEAVLFRLPGGVVTARAFVAAAKRLAATLPERGRMVNLCAGRHGFTLALAAAALRGQTVLLTSHRSAERLRLLAERHGGAYTLGEEAPEGSALPHRALDADALLAEAAGAPAGTVPAIPAGLVAALVFTSGTTGEPVAHAKHWGELADRSRAAGLRFGMTPEAPPSVVGTVPPQHMYGFETTVLLPLHAAASSWCGPAFYPSDVRDALRAVPAPRVLVTTPLQLRALLQSGAGLPPLARVISATAPLDAALAAQAERGWGTEVHEIFGATEVGSIASRRTVAEEVWTAYPGVELLPDGDGVRIAAPHAETRPLEDVVEVPAPGRFRLIGRRADLVKLGGRRASLSGLNRILAGLPGVEDGAFLVPDDLERRPSARLLAFVVAPGRSAEELLAELRARIDPVFLPRRIVKVDRLPRNELGKLPRGALAALGRDAEPA